MYNNNVFQLEKIVGVAYSFPAMEAEGSLIIDPPDL